MTFVEILAASASTGGHFHFETNTRPQIVFCDEPMDRAAMSPRRPGSLATAQRLLPASKAPSSPAVAERAAAVSVGASVCKAIGAGDDGHARPDEKSHGPKRMPMVAGLDGVAGPAAGAPDQQGRRYRAAI
jgi:hypothetical protein